MAQSQVPNDSNTQAVAEIEADVGAEHIADVYATGLLGAAGKAACCQEVLDEFELFVANVLARYPKFEAILASTLISHDEKTGILDRLLGSTASPTFLNFLKVVSRHGRLDCLGVICRRARKLYEVSQGRIRVQLTTASPLDNAQTAGIATKLRDSLGREPILQTKIDPELIGGIVLQIGDTIYDGSIANQLKVIREQMIDRSVHEIQSRRDRFSHPAGN